MSVAKKCIIWGIGHGYDELLNQLLFEIYKGNISIEALICRKEDKYCSVKDGFPVITKDELNIDTFDYIIITATSKFNEIKTEALRLGISANQIIDGSKMHMRLFDFKSYVSLIENPITILSDDCWGGYVYHSLGIPFSTPLINISWDSGEYAKFILDPLFYLETELTMIREGDLRQGIYPVGQLGDEKRNVKLELIHSISFSDAKRQWNRRKKRINLNNIFLKMGFEVGEKNKQFYLDAFNISPIKNKILFYFGNEEINGIFKTERFFWEQKKAHRVETYNYNDYMRMYYWQEINILELLTTNKNYSRYL